MNNLIKYCLYILFFLSILLGSLCADSNKMLAVVNHDYVIFDYDLDMKIKFMQLTNPNNDIYKSKEINSIMLNQLINNYLILEDGKKFNMQLNAQETEEAITSIEQKLNLAEGGLLQNALKSGLSKEYFYQELKNELTIEKIKKGISFSRSQVSQTEIQTEIQRILNLNGRNEINLSEIAVYITSQNPEDAKKKIDLIYDSLKKGGDFASLARQFSDNISDSYDGDIGWVPEIFMQPVVAKEIARLKDNEFTPPILTENYYKIYLIKGRRPLIHLNPSNPQHMDQLTKFVKQKLSFEKSKIALDDYLKEIYNNASITIY